MSGGTSRFQRVVREGRFRRAVTRRICAPAYYGFARWLPATDRSGFIACICRKLRSGITSPMFDHCGGNINVERGAEFGNGGGISVGRNSGIGIRARLIGQVTIGDNVMMGPDVLIMTTNHVFERTDIPMIEQGMREPSPVIIGNDVWIGARAIILPGVEIGEGSIIGAGAVVARSVPAWSIAVGNPAHVVRSRKAEV